MPPEFAYGEHVPGAGYYVGTDQYGTSTFAPTAAELPAGRDMDAERERAAKRLERQRRVQYRTDTISTEEMRQRSAADAFKPSTSMEKARRLRDSDREDDRRKYASLSRTTRMQVAAYESGLHAHLELGRPLPDGVRPPAGYQPPKDAA